MTTSDGALGTGPASAPVVHANDPAPVWAPLGTDDADELTALAARCLAADGGLPVAADPGFLRRRWAAPGTVTTATRDPQGRIVAACAVRPSTDPDGSTATSVIDPAVRARGFGAFLLDWGLAEAARRDGPVTVETESLTPAAEALFRSRGLRQVFAEDVMLIDLTGPAWPFPATWPAGTVLVPWSAETAPRFHAVYEASFRERPGFPGWAAETWISGVADDDGFRPSWSVLAEVPGIGDAGFVTAADGWIDQIGVVPAARGRGLGAALIHESLARRRADGATEAWLCVNVDNPAARLYRRLGFADRGRRARYRLG